MARLPDSNRPRIPPLPQFIVMTDRADGTEWVLTHDVTGEYIAINDHGLDIVGDKLGQWTDVVRYGPYEGPYVKDPVAKPDVAIQPQFRLLIRGGYLGFEQVDEPPSKREIQNARILTRRGVSRTIREILVPQVFKHFGMTRNDILGWTYISG